MSDRYVFPYSGKPQGDERVDFFVFVPAYFFCSVAPAASCQACHPPFKVRTFLYPFAKSLTAAPALVFSAAQAQ
jgi:hypothetical protein